jgi:DNA-binding ferritin-like protein
MAHPVAEQVARDMNAAQNRINEARELLSLAKEAGEDVTDMEARIRELELRKNRWERALQNRGISTGE